MDLLGLTLSNRYRVEELIGRGGMAEVYKVWDTQRGAHLAMKMLREDLAEDNAFLRRFNREAHTLESLQHPNILRFYGLEQDRELAFILMDYVEGTTLRTLIKQRGAPLTFAEILDILRPICSALGYAHRQSVAHCDIKPGNILIKKNGDVLLSDFGIARLTEAVSTTFYSPGTPAYMAPEQWLGQENLDGRTDIYALGVTLFEMLTGGEKPFSGEVDTVQGATREKIRWEHLNQKPPAIRSFLPDAPPALDWIIQKCLAKNPNQRYQSVEEFLAVVEATIGGILGLDPGEVSGRQPVSETPFTPAERSQSQPSSGSNRREIDARQAAAPNDRFRMPQPRRKALWLLFAGAFALLLIAFVLINQQRPKPPSSTVGLPAKTQPATQQAQDLPGLAQATASPTRTSSPMPTMTVTATILPTATPSPTPALQPISPQNASRVQLIERWGKGVINDMAFTSDGKLLAVAAENGLYIFDRESSRQVWFAEPGAQFTSLAFSPDNQTLATSSDDQLVSVWRVSDGKQLFALEGHTQGVLAVAFSPDGSVIASAGADRDVILWDVEKRQIRSKLAGHSEWVGALAFSPDGSQLVSASGDGTLIVWEAATGKKLASLSGHTAWVSSLAFSPDGQYLASGSGDETVLVWNVSTAQVAATLNGHSSWVTQVAFSPDGGSLASSGADKTIKIWDYRNSSVLQTYEGHSASVTALAYTPDGLTLTSGSNDSTIAFWDTLAGEREKTLIGHSAGINSVAYSPDGQFVASAGGDKHVILWDAHTGQQVRTLFAHTEFVDKVAFSPDGKLLASGSHDDTVILWEVGTGRPLHILKIGNDVLDLAFSPGDQILAVAGRNGASLWNPLNGELIRIVKRDGSFSLSFTPDGKTLSVTGDSSYSYYYGYNQSKNFDVNTGQELDLWGHDLSPSISYDVSGNFFISRSRSPMEYIDLYNISSRSNIILKGHTRAITDLAFSPDGKLAASASEDQTIIIWEVATGRKLLVLSGPAGAIRSLTFSPDGRYLVSAGDDRRIWVWGVMD